MLVDMPNSDNKLKISWKHIQGEANKTVCTLDMMKDGESVESESNPATATAVCSKKDQYNKETGRKVSLTRAIRLWKRDDRAKIWKAYFARKTGSLA